MRSARRLKVSMTCHSAISLIDESGERGLRMANLAFAGSHSVNGVAALHTELMKRTVFSDFHRFFRTASTTRPMASRRGAGSKSAIRPGAR
jgi:starch phosphorylase